jgi:sugar/nucleoside kinase (ribokinase family)
VVPVGGNSQISYFTSIASSSDIAVINPNSQNALSTISKGQKAVVFDSWATAATQIDGFVGKAAIIAYDPEHWSDTPTSEHDNLVATVQTASAATHALGMKFLLVPDVQFDTQYLAQMAPYADILIIQGQSLETNPTKYTATIQPLINTARANNPDITIYIQVSANKGSADQMLTATQSVSGYNGVAVWSDSTHWSILEQFIGLLP